MKMIIYKQHFLVIKIQTYNIYDVYHSDSYSTSKITDI